MKLKEFLSVPQSTVETLKSRFNELHEELLHTQIITIPYAECVRILTRTKTIDFNSDKEEMICYRPNCSEEYVKIGKFNSAPLKSFYNFVLDKYGIKVGGLGMYIDGSFELFCTPCSTDEKSNTFAEKVETLRSDFERAQIKIKLLDS